MPFVNKDERVYVTTYKEILLLFIFFSIVLFILYPKNMQKQQAFQETANYDASIIYLNNMLKQDPTNESLIYIVAQQNFRAGKYDIAYHWLTKLLNSKDQTIKKGSNLLAYELLKQYYFSAHALDLKEKIKTDLKTIFITIVNNKYYEKEMLDDLYNESFFLNLKSYTYSLLQEKLLYHPLDITMLRDAYYLANTLNKKEDTEHYLHLLKEVDKEHKEKWLVEEYNYFMLKKEFSKAEIALKNNASESILWEKKLALFYLANKNYSDASQVYIKLFKMSNDIKEKKQYFMDALTSMEAGNKVNEASDFLYAYEDLFLNDSAMRMLILKFYLGINDPKGAARFSKKIMNRKDK